MEIVEYRDSNFEEFVSIMDDFNSYIAGVDTKGTVKDLSDNEDAIKYTAKTVEDARSKNGFIKLAKDNDRIIGFVMGIIDNNDQDLHYQLTHVPFSDGWIGELFVKPEYRGKGIGKQLVAKANEYFKSKGCRFSRLYVLADNVDSIEVYKRLGFEVRDLEMAKEL